MAGDPPRRRRDLHALTGLQEIAGRRWGHLVQGHRVAELPENAGEVDVELVVRATGNALDCHRHATGARKPDLSSLALARSGP